MYLYVIIENVEVMCRYIVIVMAFVASLCSVANAENVIRVNQVGYLEDDVNVAVMLMPKVIDCANFNDVSQFTITNI